MVDQTPVFHMAIGGNRSYGTELAAVGLQTQMDPSATSLTQMMPWPQVRAESSLISMTLVAA